MTQRQDGLPFQGFGVGKQQADEGVFILTIYRDGSLTATAHFTERGAMRAAADLLDDQGDEDAEGGTLEDYFLRAQQLLTDEGGLMEIIPSPVYDG